MVKLCIGRVLFGRDVHVLILFVTVHGIYDLRRTRTGAE